MTGGEFSRNTAVDGAAINNTGATVVQVTDTSFVDNTATEDGGACGEVNLLLSAACLSCIVATEGGSNPCCSSEGACSGDPGCLALVRCAIGCTGNNASNCVGTCEQAPTATQDSVQSYNDFGSCVASQVCPACPPFPVSTNGEL